MLLVNNKVKCCINIFVTEVSKKFSSYCQLVNKLDLNLDKQERTSHSGENKAELLDRSRGMVGLRCYAQIFLKFYRCVFASYKQ